MRTCNYLYYDKLKKNKNNDFTVGNAGRYKFFDLSYAFNYPIYREVEYRELKSKVIYPEEVNIY